MKEEEKEGYDCGTHWFEYIPISSSVLPGLFYSFYIKQSLEDIPRLETHDYPFIWLLSYRTNSCSLSSDTQ